LPGADARPHRGPALKGLHPRDTGVTRSRGNTARGSGENVSRMNQRRRTCTTPYTTSPCGDPNDDVVDGT